MLKLKLTTVIAGLAAIYACGDARHQESAAPDVLSLTGSSRWRGWKRFPRPPIRPLARARVRSRPSRRHRFAPGPPCPTIHYPSRRGVPDSEPVPESGADTGGQPDTGAYAPYPAEEPHTRHGRSAGSRRQRVPSPPAL